MVGNHARSHQSLADALRVAQNDPHGDHNIIMANDQELMALKAMGGAGVHNPQTGLLQFYPAGAMGGGSNPSGDRNGPMGRGGEGMGHGDPGRGGGPSNDAGFSGGHVTGGYNGTGHNLPGGQLTIGGPARNYGDPYGANSPTGQALATHGLGPAQVGAALQSQHDYVDASKAYANRTGLQRIGDALMGLLPGFSSQKPALADPNSYAQGTYHTNINPAGAVAGVAGFASGIPGVSTLGEHLVGGAYSALGGPSYSFGGPGIDPQTGLSTGTGWHSPGSGGSWGGFGALGGGQAGQNNASGQQNGNRGLIAGDYTHSTQPTSVGTGAGAPIQGVQGDQSSLYPATPIQTYNPVPLNTYQGQPWPSYPGNIWVGGGSYQG